MGVVNVSSEYFDEKVNVGDGYVLNYAKAVSAGSAVTVVITTPATTKVKMKAIVDSTQGGSWSISESASVSAGSALTVYNKQRGSSKTSGIVAVGTPTITSLGNTIESHYMGSTGTGLRTASVSELYVLATATSYMVYFTSNATSTYCSITLAMTTEV
jgi:hypothetical protein